jgi:DNA-binding Lrp family transcriptional regulator
MKTLKDLDRTDRKILAVLQTDGRIANCRPGAHS